ncbi:DUF3795 domain-containing protein [Chloroflexota bacterium]
MGDLSLVGYCGLCCADCFNYKGEIADLARDLRKKLREAKFDFVSRGLAKYFKDFTNYEQCYQVLGAMVRLRCKRSCKNGGGNPSCKVRNCCQKKAICGCWECAEFEICTKLDFLKPIHGDAILKNLKKIEEHGIEVFLKGKRYF